MATTTTKSAKPLVLSDDEARALARGGRVELRRVIRPQPPLDGQWLPKEHSAAPGAWIGYTPDGRLRNDVGGKPGTCVWVCPYAQGARFWGREAYAIGESFGTPFVFYRATSDVPLGDILKPGLGPIRGKWRAAEHMPDWASRFSLVVTPGTRAECRTGRGWEWVFTVEREGVA